MSIRSLLSTTVSSTEAVIKGTVKIGAVIGEGSDWLVRQAGKINSAEVIATEQREFDINLAERNRAVLQKAKEINLQEVADSLADLDSLLAKLK